MRRDPLAPSSLHQTPCCSCGKMRWRYGDTWPVVAAVDEAVRVAIGDMLWLDVDDAKPARELAMHLEEPFTEDELQERFARLFLGVAMQRSSIGETAPIRVATAGVFAFDSGVGRAGLGCLVGPAISEDRTVLCDQAVRLVKDRARAIGRVERTEPEASPILLVRISSQIMGALVPGEE